MATDRDGSQWYFIDASNNITQLTNAQAIALNNESDDSITFSITGPSAIVVWFPEKRDLDGFFVSAYQEVADSGIKVDVSTDTTNGVDGTWTNIQGYYNANYITVPAYRQLIKSSTALAIRAVRITEAGTGGGNKIFRTIHLYGEISPGENPNRLSLWHPTLDQRITPAYFDYGDTPRSSSADLQFRVKNRSASLTAHSIRVAMEILTDAPAPAPAVVGQHTLSTDGATFVAQVNVGDVAPGAISGVVTLRRNTPSNAQLGPWAFRVFAEANSWS